MAVCASQMHILYSTGLYGYAANLQYQKSKIMKASKLFNVGLVGAVLMQTAACKKDEGGTNDTINAEKLACSYSNTKTLTDRNPNGVDYYADCLVEVYGNGNLIIEPGTTIAFESAGGILVTGTASLKAAGTTASPIKFTTANNASSWAGIHIGSNNTSNELSNCVVEKAGNGNLSELDRVGEPAAVQIAGYAKVFRTTVTNSLGVGLATSAYGTTLTVPTFDQNTFNGNGSYPVVLEKDLIRNMDLATCTFTGNFYQNIKLINSALSSASYLSPYTAHTWRDAGIPYYVSEGIDIYGGASLTLEQGVELLFDGDGYLRITDGGSFLKTNGTSANPVRLSSTNSVPGSWDGLMFETKSNSNILTHTIISNAGGNVVFYGDIKSAIRVGNYFHDATLSLNNVKIENTDGCAVAMYDADGNGQIPSGVTFIESNTIYSGNTGNDLCVE